MKKLIKVIPYTIKHIQTDNDKEYHKYFFEFVKSQKIIHFFNYPRCSKMNCFIENFNGLIQRQFVNWHHPELRDNINLFNIDLIKYLLWYNTRKQHSAIGNIPTLRYYVNTIIKALNISSNLISQKSNMLWTGAGA